MGLLCQPHSALSVFSCSGFGPFWGRFGIQNGPKTPPKTTSENEPERKAQKRENELPLHVFCCFFGPAWPQNGPQMNQHVYKKASRNEVRNLMPTRLQQCPQNCPKTVPKRAQNGTENESKFEGGFGRDFGQKKGGKAAETVPPTRRRSGADLARNPPHQPLSFAYILVKTGVFLEESTKTENRRKRLSAKPSVYRRT